VDDGNGVL